MTDEAETVEEVESNDEADTIEETESNDEAQAVEETETKDESEKILKSKNSKSEDPNMKKKLTFILAGVLGLILILTFFFVGATPVVKYGLYDKEADLNMRIAAKSKDKVAYVEGMKGLFFGKFYIPSGGKAKVTIKDTYKGCPVVGISNEAFKDSKVKNVILPNSIQYIGREAFANSSLQQINLPEGLESIGEKAFYNCNGLGDVILPDSVETISSEAFKTNSASFNLITNHTMSELAEIFENSNLENADSIQYVKKYEVIIEYQDPAINLTVTAEFGNEPDLTEIISTLKAVPGFRFIGLKHNGNFVFDRTGYSDTHFSIKNEVSRENPRIELQAAFLKEYILSYDLAGGTMAPGSLIKNPYTTEDELILIAEPSREGYTFLGWFNGNQKVTDGPWTFNSDVSLVAHWQVNDYEITYDVNGGDELAIKTQGVAYNEVFTLVTPTRAGYTFDGWYNGESKFEAGTWSLTNDVTLQAHWTANTYTITYDLQGGNPLASNTQTVTYDVAFTLVTATRTGYTFAGWYNGDAKFEAGTWNLTSDITLTAHWTANKYTITYDVNGGDTLASTTQEVTYDEFYSLVTPTRTGYAFAGWYDGTSLVGNGTWKITKGLSLTAHWTANAYNIIYDVNGGDQLSSNTQVVKYDDDYTLVTPTRTGYNFLGWYEGAKKFEAGTWKRLENANIQAHWEAIASVITLDVNTGDALAETTINITPGRRKPRMRLHREALRYRLHPEP